MITALKRFFLCLKPPPSSTHTPLPFRRRRTNAQAEEKTKRQRALLDERQDLSSTDKKVIGDMLEAFNASVADKFGVDAVSDLSIKTRTPKVNVEKQEEFAERAGMYEYEQGLTRAEAERLAMRDVFGEERSEADAFIDTYKSTQVYDDIPFFQNAYDEYVRDFEFDDTGFMKEIAALSQKPNKKKTAELRQKYGTDSKTVRGSYKRKCPAFGRSSRNGGSSRFSTCRRK